MKKHLWILAILSILLLVGCSKKDDQPTTASVETTTGIADEFLPLEDIRFHVETQDVTEPTETTEPEPVRTLSVIEVAGYTGYFVEDGSDEIVENVACILVENTTEEYLDYGLITANFGEKEYTFTVTGLPGGSSAWVLETNRGTADAGDTYAYVGETISPLRQVVTQDDRVTVELKEGIIAVTNVSEKDLPSVRVYYKSLLDDGVLLGGITYTVLAEGLKAGESRELTAGHCLPQGSVVVRLDIGE